MTTDVFERLLTPKEAAAHLGMSQDVLVSFIRSGDLRFINVGRGEKRVRRMFHPDDLREFINRRRNVEAPPIANARAYRTRPEKGGDVIGFRARQALSPTGWLSR